MPNLPPIDYKECTSMHKNSYIKCLSMIYLPVPLPLAPKLHFPF
uniref:Uncharacterized protein n=1 Tax=Arundo donax TaxID=35708 RepID=A0A0A9F8D0_ARUDO